jgi:Ca-activated chloride channel family protein
VWAPESSAWAALATVRPDAAAAIPTGAWLSLATTPVVLAMPRTRAAALGWPRKPVSLSAVLAGLRTDPTWGRYGHKEWGPIVLAMGDVTRSTPDLHTLLALTDSNRNGKVDPTEIANELLLERSVGKHAGTTADLFGIAATGKSPIAAFPATEQAVLAYNLTAEGRQLVPVHLAEGIAGADHPYLVLKGDWVTPQARQAARAFADYVLGPTGRAEFARAGFRDRDRSPTGIPASSDPRLVPATYPTRSIMAPGPAAQALVRWRALRRPANVLAVIDTSGSMADRAPGLPVTKLAVFQKAAVQSVTLFNAASRLGLWEFSSKLTPTTDYRAVLPARQLGQPIAPGVTHRDAVFAAVARMRPVGATGLYDTIDAGYREINRIWRKDQQNILVVLTDGKNEDTSGLSLAELVRRLKTARSPDRPVTVILIAYGVDADVPALNQAAAATGGRTYVALRPTDIGKVFLSAMVNR